MSDEGETIMWRATWVAGPACGGSVLLGEGRHLVGRSELATVRCDDRLLESFHVHLEVTAGWLELVQLSGRAPVVLDGDLLDCSATLEPTGCHVLDLGASRLELLPYRPSPRGTLQLASAAGGRRAVIRSGRAVPAWAPDPIALPPPDSAASGFSASLVPALIALAGSAALAALVRQPMFVVFGALGALVAVGSWVAQRCGLLRRRRRAGREREAAFAAFATGLAEQRRRWLAFHSSSVGTLARAVRQLSEQRPSLWSRRSSHADAFTVSLGLGDVTWQPVLDGDERSVPLACWAMVERSATVGDAPVPVDVGASARIALCGPNAAAAARSLLAQLAVQVGPADWRLLIVSAATDTWRAWEGMPHARGASSVVDEQGVVDLLRDGRSSTDGDDRRHLLVVVDDPRLLVARTSPVRRLVAVEDRAALIALAPDVAAAPAMCTSVLVTTADGHGSWTADLTTGELPRPLRIAGLGQRDTGALTSALAMLVDPEDAASAADALPSDVALACLFDATEAAAIAAAWAAAPPDAAPEVPVGVAVDGLVTVDLVRDGPHALVAGTTGAGKSELLRSLVVGFASRLPPDHINFVLIDYKGGAAFDACTPLPHVVGLVTDLDGRLTERALRSLRAELTRREHVLREHGANDLAALRVTVGGPVLPRLVVVVDEFAAMAIEHADLLHALIGIAQRGRSLGVHLILATQRPSGVISDDIRANTNLRIALRLHDTADALDVIGDAAPAALPRHVPGRAVMRLGPEELITFQAAHAAHELVPAIVGAAALTSVEPPRRPWCAPLPAELDAAILPPGSLGLVDLPDAQDQRPWTWTADTGHVIVAGSHGMGVTSTLIAVAVAALDSTDLFVIDAHGDERWALLADHPRCAGVVRVSERERLIRTVDRLAGGRCGGEESARRMLVIDGFGALRLELESVELSDCRAAFERVVSDGSLGVDLLIGTDAPATLPATVVSRCGQRWVHHLNDPHDAVVLGVPAAQVPARVPGRMMLARGRDVAEAQVARVDAARLLRRPDVRRIEVIGTLPSALTADELGLAERHDGLVSVPLGRRFDDLHDACLDIADGEHALVIGPGRSGRSTVLVRILRAWVDARPRGWTGVVAPRRSPLTHLAEPSPKELFGRVPHEGPALLVIDDAELVDDDTGTLARLLACRRPGLLVVAAGRPESLRQSYGHWSSGVRRSRLGVLMAGVSDLDADLLGVTLPRWPPIPPRPGLAYVVADGTATLVQCALDASVPAESRPGQRRRPSARPLAAVS